MEVSETKQSSANGTQNYTNHIRKHPLYHYVLVPGTIILPMVAIVNLVYRPDLANGILLALATLLHLIVFVVRDYAKKNQDRIIRAELRLRYFELTHERFAVHESRFSLQQLLALRFACDDEFIHLINDSTTVTRTADQIKRNIINWNPDNMRV